MGRQKNKNYQGFFSVPVLLKSYILLSTQDMASSLYDSLHVSVVLVALSVILALGSSVDPSINTSGLELLGD